MRVARSFSEERAVRLGVTKCVLLLKTNEEDRPALEKRVLTGELSTTENLRHQVTAVNRTKVKPNTTARRGQEHVRVKLGTVAVDRLKELAKERGTSAEDSGDCGSAHLPSIYSSLSSSKKAANAGL